MVISTKTELVYSLFEHVADEINRNLKGMNFNTRVKFIRDKLSFAILWDEFEHSDNKYVEEFNKLYDYSMQVLSQKIIENMLDDEVNRLSSEVNNK